MKNNTAIYIWEKVIQTTATQIYDSIDKELKIKYELNGINYKNKNKLINDYYLESRKRFKNLLSDTNSLLDIHKIASCYTYALLKVPYFEYNEIANIEGAIRINLINYELAFAVGVHILYVGLLSENVDNNKKFNLIKMQGGLAFPKTNEGHDKNYVDIRIKTLYLNDINGIEFDLLSYAELLYWIELYNKHIIDKKYNKEYIKQEEIAINI